MDKDILVQYTDLQEEIRDIRRRAERARGQMERLETEGTVLDALISVFPLLFRPINSLPAAKAVRKSVSLIHKRHRVSFPLMQ